MPIFGKLEKELTLAPPGSVEIVGSFVSETIAKPYENVDLVVRVRRSGESGEREKRGARREEGGARRRLIVICEIIAPKSQTAIPQKLQRHQPPQRVSVARRGDIREDPTVSWTL